MKIFENQLKTLKNKLYSSKCNAIKKICRRKATIEEQKKKCEFVRQVLKS